MRIAELLCNISVYEEKEKENAVKIYFQISLYDYAFFVIDHKLMNKFPKRFFYQLCEQNGQDKSDNSCYYQGAH